MRRLRHALHEFADLLRDLTPARRRSRYGDIDFDWDHRVDTTAANVGVLTRLRGVLAGSQYQPADPVLFAESMAALPINFSRYTFIDTGSGKGRALLMACAFPFCRVIGIEIVPELHAAAERNLALIKPDRRKCEKIETWLGDARNFSFPSEPTVLFLFNPFPEWVLEAVVANLRLSLQQHPRKVWVVYHNPVLEHVLGGSGFLRRISGTLQAAVYANDAPEP